MTAINFERPANNFDLRDCRYRLAAKPYHVWALDYAPLGAYQHVAAFATYEGAETYCQLHDIYSDFIIRHITHEPAPIQPDDGEGLRRTMAEIRAIAKKIALRKD